MTGEAFDRYEDGSLYEGDGGTIDGTRAVRA